VIDESVVAYNLHIPPPSFRQAFYFPLIYSQTPATTRLFWDSILLLSMLIQSISYFSKSRPAFDLFQYEVTLHSYRYA